jgi:hypothetical protein
MLEPGWNNIPAIRTTNTIYTTNAFFRSQIALHPYLKASQRQGRCCSEILCGILVSDSTVSSCHSHQP